jgi:hypothetical protein
VEVALPVAAFESSGHGEKFKTSRNCNVKGTHPSPTAGEGWGTRQFKGKFKYHDKIKDKGKTTSKTKQLQDELPEWYHRRRSVVNCGKYGRERPGHPPPRIDCRR